MAPELRALNPHDGRAGIYPASSQQTIAATEAAIETYQGIVSRGGWSEVPANQQLKIGVKSKNVQGLRQRLIESGDLDAAAGMGSTYDLFVEAAVKRFQLRHGRARPASSATRHLRNSTSARTRGCSNT